MDAEGAGINRAALSLFERGRREPKIRAVERLARVYGVTVEWLLGLTGAMGPG